MHIYIHHETSMTKLILFSFQLKCCCSKYMWDLVSISDKCNFENIFSGINGKSNYIYMIFYIIYCIFGLTIWYHFNTYIFDSIINIKWVIHPQYCAWGAYKIKWTVRNKLKYWGYKLLSN